MAQKVAEAGSPKRIAAAKKFAIEAARLALNTRCHSITVLDVAGISPVCDFFVIATGTSNRQMQSVGQELIELAQAKGFAPLRKSNLDSDSWILVDCFDVVVHLFNDESRHYYDLDNLWGDAKKVSWEDKKSGK